MDLVQHETVSHPLSYCIPKTRQTGVRKVKREELDEKGGNWDSVASNPASGSRRTTTTWGCNAFPAFVHIHTGSLRHSQQMARGSNAELHSGMGCNESSETPIPNPKRSVGRVFTREGMLPWKENATGWRRGQKEAEMFRVGVGCSFEQIRREHRHRTAVVTKPLWRAPFRQNCVAFSLLGKSLWQHFWNRIWIISVTDSNILAY